MGATPQHRAQVQQKGLNRVRKDAFDAVLEAVRSGQCSPCSATCTLLFDLVEKAYRIGVETQSDALQPEFTEMSMRIAELEEHLSGMRHPFIVVHTIPNS